MFPENVVQATFQRVATTYDAKKTPKLKNGNNSIVQPIGVVAAGVSNITYRKKIENVSGMNILGIIVFCTGFGIIISKLGEKGHLIVAFFVILETVIMRLVEALMWLAPIGIVSLIVGNLLDLDDLGSAATVLFVYVITVLSGLIIHTIVTVPLLYFFITRKNPIRIARGLLQAMFTAFGTASSGAALPVSINCMEEKLNVDRRIARFVLSLGSTINMVSFFIFTATIASLGLNSVPAGLVSILIVLSIVGLPTKDVSLIITADWLIDRVRTMVNVLGDAYAASIVEHVLGNRLSGIQASRPQFELGKEGEFLTNEIYLDKKNHFITQYSPLANAQSGYAPALRRCSETQHLNISMDSKQVFTWKEQMILNRLYKNVLLNKVQHI